MGIFKEQALSNDQGYQEEGEEALDLTTVWEYFEDTVAVKLSKDYIFVPAAEGRFSSMDVYFRSALNVDGLNLPKGFTYWKQLSPKDKLNFAIFRNAVKSTLEILSSGASKSTLKLIGLINSGLLGRIGDTRSELSMQAYSRIGDVELRRTLTGMSGYNKIVPQISWFPEALQAIEPTSLLSIFSKAEAQVLMLVLGKAMVGYNGCQTAEGEVLTTARAYAIMVDTEGGLGKSTLMNYVRSAMTTLGYKVTSVNTNGSRFGWGSVALSDLGLIDDLTNDKLGQIIGGNDIKQLVTNGTFRVEEKSQPSVEVRSITTILGASNTTDPRHFFNMDGGGISRLNQLRTKSKAELADEFGHFQNGATTEYWTAIGDKLGVSVEVITMYILARSAEMFMEYTGNIIEDGQIVHKEDTLLNRMDLLRKQLKIDPNFTYVDDLTISIATFSAATYLASKASVTKADLKKFMRGMRLTPEVIIKYISNYGIKLPGDLDKLCRPGSLDIRSVAYAQAKTQQLEGMKATKKYLEAFAASIGELSSSRGFCYPTTLSFYESSWDKAVETAVGAYDLINIVNDPEHYETVKLKLGRIAEDIFK